MKIEELKKQIREIVESEISLLMPLHYDNHSTIDEFITNKIMKKIEEYLNESKRN